jgi:hypothetical protein
MVRLAFAALCAFLIIGLIDVYGNVLDGQGRIQNVIWNGMFWGLFLISYVVNIGFSRAWKKWPAAASAGVFLLLAAYGYFTQGSFETVTLASAAWVWEFYLFAHLGLSFLLSALLGTPGCEMRALHDLYSRLTGRSTKEHFCPVGPLSAIDRWESGRREA